MVTRKDGSDGNLENLYLFDNDLEGCIPRRLIEPLEHGLNTAEEALNRYERSPFRFVLEEGKRFVKLPKRVSVAVSWVQVYEKWLRPTYGTWLPPCAPPPPNLPLEFDGQQYSYETHHTDKLVLLAIRDHFVDAGSDEGEFEDWNFNHVNSLAQKNDCGVGKWHGVNTRISYVWNGRFVDTECRVIELSLDKRELKGTIPKEVGHLGRLKSLNLSQNCLYGSIPAELGHLWWLDSLALNIQGQKNNNKGNGVAECDSASSLSGELPPAIGNLSNLTQLNLFDNPELTGELPPEFGNLGKLKHLKLEHTGFTGCLPPSIVQNFSDPVATGIFSPILGIGASIAFTAATGGPLGGWIGYGIGVAFGEVVGRLIGAVVDPLIKPGALHWLPWVGSELHNVKLHCDKP